MKFTLQKKEKVPIILSEREAKILGEYKRRVEMFDQMFKLCCCWVGWDMLLDLIPVVGKVISLMFAVSLYRLACKADISPSVRSSMRWHTTVNFVIGLIPGVGLIFDIFYQANAKNCRILEKYLYQRARTSPSQPVEPEAAPVKPAPSFKEL